MIHLYALARVAPPGVLSGILDAPVSVVDGSGLLAVVSEHAGGVPVSREAGIAHLRVVTAAARHGPTLPVRFGQQHHDVAALQARLEADRERLARLLEQVGSHVEFVVRPPSPAPVSVASTSASDTRATSTGGPGRAYLERRRSLVLHAERQRAQTYRRLLDATEPLVPHAAAVHDLEGPHGVERCFLVPEATAPRFATRAHDTLEPSFVVGGPWPPFTFASLPADGEAP